MLLLKQLSLGLFVLTLGGAVVTAVRWRRAPSAQRPLLRAQVTFALGQTVLAGGLVVDQQTGWIWPFIAMIIVGGFLIRRSARALHRALRGATPAERATG